MISICNAIGDETGLKFKVDSGSDFSTRLDPSYFTRYCGLKQFENERITSRCNKFRKSSVKALTMMVFSYMLLLAQQHQSG